MKSITFIPKDKHEFDFFAEMLRKMNIQIITNEEKEDQAMGKLIEAGMKTRNVSKATVLKSLRK
jgi:hypothetical protein